MELIDSGRYIAGLLFTIGLIFGLWFLVRRYFPGLIQGAPVGSDKSLHIQESLHIDPRRRIVVVHDGQREHVVLLGITGDLLIESRDLIKNQNTNQGTNEVQPSSTDSEKIRGTSA